MKRGGLCITTSLSPGKVDTRGSRSNHCILYLGQSIQLLEIRRAHWGIETGRHYRRDVTLKEDAARMTVSNTGIIMTSINSLVLALIRQAAFHKVAK